MNSLFVFNIILYPVVNIIRHCLSELYQKRVSRRSQLFILFRSKKGFSFDEVFFEGFGQPVSTVGRELSRNSIQLKCFRWQILRSEVALEIRPDLISSLKNIQRGGMALYSRDLLPTHKEINSGTSENSAFRVLAHCWNSDLREESNRSNGRLKLLRGSRARRCDSRSVIVRECDTRR